MREREYNGEPKGYREKQIETKGANRKGCVGVSCLFEGVGECEVVGDEPGAFVKTVAHDVVTGHRVHSHQHIDGRELLAVLGLALFLAVMPQFCHCVQHLTTKTTTTTTKSNQDSGSDWLI